MLTPTSFFDLSSFAHQDLFANTTYTWEALQRLRSYMDKKKYFHSPFSENSYEPFTKTVVIHDNNILSSDGLTIEFGDERKDIQLYLV